MEGEPTQPPLKVCPHCSVASRTDADTCPSCGKPYARSGPTLRWSWWLAIPIVAAAFAIGYFGISELFDGDGSESDTGTITLEEGEEIPDTVSRADLEARLGEPAVERPQRGSAGTTCLFYSITGQADSVWQFCFKGEQLESSGQVSG
jgi:hypothetical protein